MFAPSYLKASWYDILLFISQSHAISLAEARFQHEAVRPLHEYMCLIIMNATIIGIWRRLCPYDDMPRRARRLVEIVRYDMPLHYFDAIAAIVSGEAMH